jgi:hypothetical protein
MGKTTIVKLFWGSLIGLVGASCSWPWPGARR